MFKQYTVNKPSLVKDTLKLSSSPVKLEVEEIEDNNTDTFSVSPVPPAENNRHLVVDSSVITDLKKEQAITEK